MKTKSTRLIFTISGLLGLLMVGVALAAPLAYTLPWWTVDTGGGSYSGGNYTLSSTIGQSDAGLLLGGTYTLHGGFWGGAWQPVSRLYLPMTIR